MHGPPILTVDNPLPTVNALIVPFKRKSATSGPCARSVGDEFSILDFV